jgi:thiol:disulfide interchange protein
MGCCIRRLAAWLAGVLVWAGAGAAVAQFESLRSLDGELGITEESAEEPMTVRAEIVAPTGGQPAMLRITAELADGWHTYSITQPPKGPIRTTISVEEGQGYAVAGEFRATPPPEVRIEPLFDNVPVEEHQGAVTWEAPLKISEGVALASLEIKGHVRAQLCATTCLPPRRYEFVARLAPASDGTYRPEGLHASVTVWLEPPVAEPGTPVNVVVRVEPDAGYHVYPLLAEMSVKSGEPTLLAIKEASALKPGKAFARRPPERHAGPKDAGTVSYYYTEPIEFVLPLEVPADLAEDAVTLTGLLGLQTCTDRTCDRPRGMTFRVTLPVGSQARGNTPAVAYGKAGYNEIKKLLPEAKGTEVAVAADVPQTLLLALALGFLGGLILNLMPCVLPVIGLKILAFVEQSQEEVGEPQAGEPRGRSFRRSRAFWLNLWYTAGILSVFLVLAALSALAGQSWGQQFQKMGFKLGMAAVVFAMALSFLGVWEIPIPGFAGGKGANKLASREGRVGAFAKGVLTTVLATPCSGPFLTTVFAFTLTQPPWVTYAVFLSIGLGMASPYLVIGMYPALIRWLPKPGAWMETFKEIMGFVLLGTVVWLLYSVREDHLVAAVALLFGMWAGLWLIGRTPVYAPLGRRLAAWACGLALAAVLGGGSFWLFMPRKALLDWQPFSRSALEAEIAKGRTVLVDFTANWCANCKLNEVWALNRTAVRDKLKELDAVAIRADWTHESEEISTLLNELGYKSIPLCVIYPAGRPQDVIVLKDIITQSQVIEALERAGPSHTASGSTAMKR